MTLPKLSFNPLGVKCEEATLAVLSVFVSRAFLWSELPGVAEKLEAVRTCQLHTRPWPASKLRFSEQLEFKEDSETKICLIFCMRVALVLPQPCIDCLLSLAQVWVPFKDFAL